jgi:hypothetical protein
VTSELKGNSSGQRPFSIASSRRIEAVVAVLNSLPAGQPGIRHCPNDPGITVRLAFYSRGAVKPLAVARIDPYGCGGVQLTIGGQPQPSLESQALPGASTSRQPPLVVRIGNLLGVKIKTRPRH